jgi:uncharacterized membrane protein
MELMSITCPKCAAAMPDTAAFCPGCGRGMRAHARAKGMVGVLPEPLAGALAYFVLPAILFLLIEPYKNNRFLRFHSFQTFAVCLAAVLVGALLRIAGVVLYFIPLLGHLLVWLVSMFVILAFLMVWIVLVVKALQGEEFQLPVIGEFAEKQANEA